MWFTGGTPSAGTVAGVYVVSVCVVLVAVVLLGLVLARLAGPARRFTAVQGAATKEIDDQVRMLIARLAALRVRLAERRAPTSALDAGKESVS